MSREFTIHVDPVGAPRMTQRDKWKKRPRVVTYFAFRDQIRMTVGGAIKGVPREIHLTFFLTMPKSWGKKQRVEALAAGCETKPDIDNLIKGVLDALFEEDKRVQKVVAEKVWGNHGAVRIFIP